MVDDGRTEGRGRQCDTARPPARPPARLVDVWLRGVAIACALLVVPHSLLAQEPAPGSSGPEHEVLLSLIGSWDVHEDDRIVGSATAVSRLDGRFLEVEIVADADPVRHAIYTFGFDRRHEVYTVVAMDDTGTYWVTGRGTRDGTQISMYGEDEDPVMRAMGFDKEFAIILHVHSSDHVEIETRLIDPRTAERREMSFFTFDLRR